MSCLDYCNGLLYGLPVIVKLEKSIMLNYRACMGTPLQRMYGHIHIIANFSAINDLNGFNTSHVRILFTKEEKV